MTAILDFDRVRYVYSELDVARAVLSGALRNGHLNLPCVSAFVSGYCAETGTHGFNLVRALRLLWCLEFQWIQPWGAHASRSEKRFFEELTWLTGHWWELDSLLADV